MRTSAGGPFRTVMMIVPLIVVAVLASMGGYHYRTVVASQSPDELSPDLPAEAVVLGAEVGESAHCSTNELFADFPGDISTGNSVEVPKVSSKPNTTPPQVDHLTKQDQGGRPRRVRPKPGDSRQFPAAALAGWQVSDSGSGESNSHGHHHNSAETSNAQRADLLFEDVAPVSKNPVATELRSGTSLSETGNTETRQPRIASTKGRKPRRSKPQDSSNEASENSRPRRQPRTLQEAALRLRDLGIRKYRLETNPEDGSFRFRCAVTENNNPSIRRQFDALADEPLLAVRKVLRQVEEWRAQE